jgi:hypothetical protein
VQFDVSTPVHHLSYYQQFRSLEGGNMNKTFDKWTVDAANYFKEEVLDIEPDISRKDLSDMVGEYIYYQQADVGKDEAHEVVQATCF